LPPDHFLPGFQARTRKAAVTYSHWLQQALAEPVDPCTKGYYIDGSYSPNDLTTRFVEMIADGDDNMADIPED
jgi:hypothetical protein